MATVITKVGGDVGAGGVEGAVDFEVVAGFGYGAADDADAGVGECAQGSFRVERCIKATRQGADGGVAGAVVGSNSAQGVEPVLALQLAYELGAFWAQVNADDGAIGAGVELQELLIVNLLVRAVEGADADVGDADAGCSAVVGRELDGAR